MASVRNVILVPRLDSNLLSVSALVKKGINVFDKEGCKMFKIGKLFCSRSEPNGLYKMKKVVPVLSDDYTLAVRKCCNVTDLRHCGCYSGHWT